MAEHLYQLPHPGTIRMTHRPASIALLIGLAVSVTSCSDERDPVYGEPGTPLPTLTPAQLGQFQAGAALFNKVYTPEEGLGPLFNENQCSACHTSPAIGGTTGFEFVTKATTYDSVGGCNLLVHEGGENIRTQATPLLRDAGIQRANVPTAASHVGRFTTPFLFGLGLVEAIDDQTILSRADPDDRNGDGISGRVGRTEDGRLARFTRKAEVATIREFVDSALRLEMGLTTPLEPEEATIDGTPFPDGTDPAPEPEVDDTTLDLLTAFVRYLAPPAPTTPRSEAHRDSIEQGRRLFEDIGCQSCHTPTMTTGAHEVPALHRQRIALYSDLLLHDMGPAFSGVCGRTATPTEVRTEMLMGLRHRQLFLHNGRAHDLREAVLAHGGEAQRSRDAFARLGWVRQEYVVRFLQSL